MPPRTLPIRIPPIPGEALESWLGAIAQRLDTPWGDLLAALAPPKAGQPTLRRRDLTLFIHPHEAEAIAQATGIWRTTIEASTLGYYEGHLITIDRSTGRVQSPWKFRRSRFCPHCLRASGSRWQASWRLPWIFVCRIHRCLLVDVCPKCEQIQRTSPWWLTSHDVPDLSRCSNIVDSGGFRRRCDGVLALSAALPLAPEHPLWPVQARLSRLLSQPVIAFGVYERTPTSSLEVLRDLRLLAARMLSLTDVCQVREILDVRGKYSRTEHLVDTELSLERWATPASFVAHAPALITGLGIKLALDILGCGTIDDAASRLRPLITNARSEGRVLTTATFRWGNPTPVMDAVYTKACEMPSVPKEYAEYWTVAALRTYPRKQGAATIRSVPTYFWRDWCFRFSVGKLGQRATRPVLSMMLVCNGTQVSVSGAARSLNLSTTEKNINYVVDRLRGHTLWPNILAAIMRLADYLSKHPSPIDYERRRQLDYRNLLPPPQWNAIYDSAYNGPGGRARVGEIARSWLFERISMQPRSAAPFTMKTRWPERLRTERIAMFTPAMIDALDDAGLQYLAHNNVHGEPLTWTPPHSLVDDLELPGPDPASTDVTRLHQLAKDPSMTTAAIARQLEVPADIVRYLLEQFPLERPTVDRPIRSGNAEMLLSKADLLRLYDRDRLTLAAIAARIGVGPDAVADLARKYGIPIRHYYKINPDNLDWLYEEHVVKQRTITDIAQEIGVTICTVSRAAKKHGIPVCRYPRTRRQPSSDS